MSFIETPRLNDRVRLGYVAGPEYSTNVVNYKNGNERRNSNWSLPRRKYQVPYTNITPTQYADLVAAFYAAKGQANGLRFKDWLDYSATNQSLGNAPSGTTAVQLIKTYTYGSSLYTRTIKKPVSATVYQAGIAKPGTLATSTGLFTPSTSWTEGQALTWTGEFDVPVRFASDFLPATWDNFQVRSLDIELVEIFV